MFPPTPTKDPQQLLGNVWSSLSRGSQEHWGQQATVVPSEDGEGYTATLRTASHIPDDSWEHASKFIRAYARASHWTVNSLTRKSGYVQLNLKYSPPKPRPQQNREPQKIA